MRRLLCLLGLHDWRWEGECTIVMHHMCDGEPTGETYNVLRQQGTCQCCGLKRVRSL
jgi:hypothetical protein